MTWNQQGQNGADGASVSSAFEPAGANCSNGGSRFTTTGGNTTYACNGADGAPGSGATFFAHVRFDGTITQGNVTPQVALGGLGEYVIVWASPYFGSWIRGTTADGSRSSADLRRRPESFPGRRG